MDFVCMKLKYGTEATSTNTSKLSFIFCQSACLNTYFPIRVFELIGEILVKMVSFIALNTTEELSKLLNFMLVQHSPDMLQTVSPTYKTYCF